MKEAYYMWYFDEEFWKSVYQLIQEQYTALDWPNSKTNNLFVLEG